MAKLPEVAIHFAQTLDGRIATRTGHSQWISGEGSLRFAHELRSAHDAVLVGVGTIVADNPRLTVRLAPGTSPLRIVADSTLRLPHEAHVLRDGAAKTLIATTERADQSQADALRARGVDVLVLGQDARGRVDLRDLLRCLGHRGIASLLVEGGHAIITTMLREQLANRLIVCIAPKIVGTGIDAVGDLGILRLGEALRLSDVRVRRLGEDVIFDGLMAQEREQTS